MNDTPQKDDRDHTAGEEALLELAERCEREEPSRKLDGAIAAGIGWRRHRLATENFWWIEPGCADPDPPFMHNQVHTRPPEFTTSLDIAMTLLPSFTADGPYCLSYWDMNVEPSPMYGAGTRASLTFESDEPRITATARTPALALCAASLRTRAAIAKATRRA